MIVADHIFKVPSRLKVTKILLPKLCNDLKTNFKLRNKNKNIFRLLVISGHLF